MPQHERKPEQVKLLMHVLRRFKFFRVKMADWHPADVRDLLTSVRACVRACISGAVIGVSSAITGGVPL